MTNCTKVIYFFGYCSGPILQSTSTNTLTITMYWYSIHQLVAAMYNHAHIITALLEYGADPEVKDGDGRTPMYYGMSLLL